MKIRQMMLWLVAVLCWVTLPVKAAGLGDIRINARFLTDRMAFELNLNQSQYDDLYEVNFDFLNGIDPYVGDLAYSRAAAMDAYYRYLDERNDDLRWILSSAEYLRFMAIDYFFRPIYAVNHCCYLRVYQIYPNRSFFYFGRPHHYLTYRGGHSRFHCGGKSYYRTHFSRRYTHAVYGGAFRARPDFRKHDFGPNVRPEVRPGVRPGGPGYHFTPVHPKPDKGKRPGREEVNRPGNRLENSGIVRPNKPVDRKSQVGKRSDGESRRPVTNRMKGSTDKRDGVSRSSRSGVYSRPNVRERSHTRENVRKVERKNNNNNRKQTDRHFLREM